MCCGVCVCAVGVGWVGGVFCVERWRVMLCCVLCLVCVFNCGFFCCVVCVLLFLLRVRRQPGPSEGGSAAGSEGYKGKKEGLAGTAGSVGGATKG